MKWISINSPETRGYFKFVALCLLALIGISALTGGIPMMVHGKGDFVGLSIDYLVHTPFESYRLPGILLVVMNGLGSIIAFVVLYNNWQYHSYTVRGMGLILLVWIVMQGIVLQAVNPLHILFGVMALTLIVIGNYLKRFE